MLPYFSMATLGSIAMWHPSPIGPRCNCTLTVLRRRTRRRRRRWWWRRERVVIHHSAATTLMSCSSSRTCIYYWRNGWRISQSVCVKECLWTTPQPPPCVQHDNKNASFFLRSVQMRTAACVCWQALTYLGSSFFFFFLETRRGTDYSLCFTALQPVEIAGSRL